MAHKPPTFRAICADEVRMDYRGKSFLIKTQDRGVYGMGRAVQLYLLEDMKRTHLKELGWLKGDNHGGESKPGAFLPGIVTFLDCRSAARKYVDSIM